MTSTAVEVADNLPSVHPVRDTERRHDGPVLVPQ